MQLSTGSEELERALCASSATFRRLLNREATKPARDTYAAVRTPYLNVLASALDEMAHDYKLAVISKDQTRKKSTRTEAYVDTLSRKDLRPTIHAEVKPAFEAA